MLAGRASHEALVVKNPPANAGDIRGEGSIPGSGRSPGEGHDNPLQYSCLENPHGQRSLVGYSPWGPQELDATEQHEANAVEERVSGLLKKHKGRVSPNLETLVIRVSLL